MSNAPQGTSMEGATKWVLVPAEPTELMLQAGEQAMEWRGLPGTYVLESADESLIYKAMLAAAPKPPANPSRDALLAEAASELMIQWECNHAEHCGHNGPHDRCHWPMPDILTRLRAQAEGRGE